MWNPMNKMNKQNRDRLTDREQADRCLRQGFRGWMGVIEQKVKKAKNSSTQITVW